jgi:GAF domain-containing protein/HAMP domain-containing protein
MAVRSEPEKRKRSTSLATTLAIAFVVLSVVTLVLASGLQIWVNFQTQQDLVSAELGIVALGAAQEVSGFIEQAYGVMDSAAQAVSPFAGMAETQRLLLESLLSLDPAFREVALVDKQGQEVNKLSRLTVITEDDLVDRGGSDLFASVSQNQRYVSSVYIDEVTSEPLVTVAIPINNAFGEFEGALVAEVNLKFMWDLVDSLRIGEEGLAYVVDEQGNLIAFGDASRVLRGENLGALAEVAKFTSGLPTLAQEREAEVSTGINGSSVLATHIPLGEPNWAVVVELPVVEAYQAAILSVGLSVGIVLIMAVLAGIAGVLVARRLSAPLLNLTATANRIAEGEMALQAEYKGPAEVLSLAAAFNSMTAQLREFIGTLEQRVADRTRGLRAAAEVSQATTAMLDLDELLQQVVNMVRERFDLYYVGLFLSDDAGQFAALRAGTGEAGQQMIVERHALAIGGSSMIGQCVANGQASIALDVGEEAVRFDNPLLPDTRSEMALPLRARGQVIGAMTVQDTKEAAFDEADIAVMQTMADQVAVAIDNARLFTETQAALEEMESIHQRYLGQAWTEYVGARAGRGYIQTQEGILPLLDEAMPDAQQAGDEGALGERSSALVTPIVQRDQPIGALGLRQAEDKRQWTTEEVALVETIAEQFALAADNLRLLEETQRRAAQEQLIAEVASRVRESLDLQTVLETVANELYERLGLEKVTVYFSAEEQAGVEPHLEPVHGNGDEDGALLA